MNQVDPFLYLVEDHKLRAVKTGSDHPANVYGSKEDDSSASKSLAEIEIIEDQTRESFASEILKSLENLSEVKLLYESFKHLRLPLMIKEFIVHFVMFYVNKVWLFLQSELSIIREKLLNEFLPDDMCPLGSQLFMGSPHKIRQVDLKINESLKEVIILNVF